MLKIAQSAGKINSLSYILGVYLGDGCVSPKEKPTRFRLNTIDEDFALATKRELENLIGKEVKIDRYKDNRYKNYYYYSINTGCKELCRWLQEITEFKQVIPKFVFNLNKEPFRELVAGVMDSEGYATNAKWITNRDGKHWEGYHLQIGIKATDHWMYGFYELLKKNGVSVNKIRLEKPRKEWYKNPIRFIINHQSFKENKLYFKIRRKQNRVIPSETIRLTTNM